MRRCTTSLNALAWARHSTPKWHAPSHSSDSFPTLELQCDSRNDGWWSTAFPTQLSIAETRRRSLSSPLHTIVGALVVGGIAAAANMRMNQSARSAWLVEVATTRRSASRAAGYAQRWVVPLQ